MASGHFDFGALEQEEAKREEVKQEDQKGDETTEPNPIPTSSANTCKAVCDSTGRPGGSHWGRV